jgi:hypothetical protein
MATMPPNAYMLLKKVFFGFGFLFCFLTSVGAQGVFSNLKTGQYPLQPRITLPDTLDLISGSTTCLCGRDTIAFEQTKRQIVIDTIGLSLTCPTVTILYRTYPFALGRPLFRFDSTALTIGTLTQIPIEYDFGEQNKGPESLWGSPGLNTQGTYTRGLSLGNNQNLNFNSDLNLQLSGRLGNEIEINAAIADNSVPIQPDGSTRNIQEFDRIYVEIKRNRTSLLAGDFELSQPNGRYFSRYYKKLQGVQVRHDMALPRWSKNPRAQQDSLSVRASAAISRGKFNRLLIQGQEGNQGPYRLNGADNERFIIVLANTEKVFIDGRLLSRGLQGDYVIDYNLGEVTFTSNRLITKDIRIIIEFEYVVQQYLRSTITSETEWTSGRMRAYVSAYAEQDNPNTSGIQELRRSDRLRLASIGDSLSRAFSDGIDTLKEGFDPNRVLYKWVDTTFCGATFPILMFSTERDKANLTVRWTEVPRGQGNYVLASSNANGRVYAFSPPDAACAPTGQYEPITKLAAPESRQIYAVGGEIKTSKTNKYAAELALSNRDPNRLSAIHDQDNQGLGLALSGQQDVTLGTHALRLTGQYELAQKQFRAINPYRVAEFTRDWNTEQQASETRTEQLMQVGAEYPITKTSRINYQYQRFDRMGAYIGNKHVARAVCKQGGVQAMTEWNQLQTQSGQSKTTFLRPKGDISYLFGHKTRREITDTISGNTQNSVGILQVGVYAEREKNPRYNQANELTPQSFWYDMARLYVRMPEQKSGITWEANRTRRIDYAPLGSLLSRSTQADEYTVMGIFLPTLTNVTHRVNWNLTNRNLQVRDTLLTALRTQTTWLGRVDYQFSALKNAISTSTGYEIGSGQNPKLEFTYVRVNPGEGVYAWIDRNQDSVLTVDEMELSAFQDQAAYVRLAISTNQFIQTNSLALNQYLRFEPRIIWAQKKGIKKAISYFSVLASWQLNRKTLDNAIGVSIWSPFELGVADTSLVNVNVSGRQTLFFQRAHPRFETSVAQATLRNRYVATTGFESRGTNEWELRTRYNITSALILEAQGRTRKLGSDAEFFNQRDYQINEYSAAPEVSYIYDQQLRATFKYQLVQAKNSIGERESLVRNQGSFQLSWQPKPKRNLRLGTTSNAMAVRSQISLVANTFVGNGNTPVAFVMMEGLQNGKNYLWNISLDRQLSKFLQISIQYDGRRPDIGNVVHVGRAQVRAIF